MGRKGRQRGYGLIGTRSSNLLGKGCDGSGGGASDHTNHLVVEPRSKKTWRPARWDACGVAFLDLIETRLVKTRPLKSTNFKGTSVSVKAGGKKMNKESTLKKRKNQKARAKRK